MITLGDFLRFTIEQTMLNQRLLNVFYYQVMEWTGNANYEDVVSDFLNNVVGSLIKVQHEFLTHTGLRIENLTNGLDDISIGYNIPGTYNETPVMPSFVAYSLKLNVSTKTTRPGGKRIAGVAEGLVANNVQTLSPGQVADLEFACETALSIDEPNLGDGQLRPVIVGRTPLGVIDLTRTQPVSNAVVNDVISSQVSRKPAL